MRVVPPEALNASVQITVLLDKVGWFPVGHLDSPQQPQAHLTGEAAVQPSLELLSTHLALPTCSRPCPLGEPWKIVCVSENVLQEQSKTQMVSGKLADLRKSDSEVFCVL